MNLFRISNFGFRISPRLLPLALLGALPGCAGYQLGPTSLARPEIRTIYLPLAASDDLRPEIGERLTEAVAKKIEQRTAYKLGAPATADSVLTLRIGPLLKRTLVEDINDEPRALEAEWVVQASWTDRRGVELLTPFAAPLPAEFRSLEQRGMLIPEPGSSLATAQLDAVDRLADEIVGQLDRPW